MSTATPKQISYALALLGQAGYPTTYMNASFSSLGATMRQRKGTVRNWLSSMEVHEISQLIDELKERI